MFLLIDKPKGMTSHDVVSFVRKITEIKRVGHAGTLDPNATGLLILGIGRESTKKLGYIIKNRKTYIAEIFLGEERDTDDVEGKATFTSSDLEKPTKEYIEQYLASYIGEIDQEPPNYSAVKIRGRKAYELARKGRKVKLGKRKVTVYSVKLLEYDFPILQIELKVSSGFYVRSLARDLGRKIGCGAYLKNLRRTKIGNYKLKEAVKLKQLTKRNWREKMLKNI